MKKCEPSQCRVQENSRQGEQHMQSHRIICGNKVCLGNHEQLGASSTGQGDEE